MRSVFRKSCCFDVTVSFWQLASVVIKEGEESYTTKKCQKCYNESLKAKREKPLTNVLWRDFAEQKTHHERLWKMMGKEQYERGMWEKERDRVNMFREQAEEEKQAGIQGQWQLESPAKEYLQQVKRRDDTYCTEIGKNIKAFSGLK